MRPHSAHVTFQQLYSILHGRTMAPQRRESSSSWTTMLLVIKPWVSSRWQNSLCTNLSRREMRRGRSDPVLSDVSVAPALDNKCAGAGLAARLSVALSLAGAHSYSRMSRWLARITARHTIPVKSL